MYCRECGAPLLENDKFCTKCGRPVMPAEPPTEPLFKTDIKDLEAMRPEADPLENIDLQKPGEDMHWNTSYYPNSAQRPEPKKTPDIDFNWHIGEGEFRAQSTRELLAYEERYNEQKKAEAREAARRRIEEARAAEEAARMESESLEEQHRDVKSMALERTSCEEDDAQGERTTAEAAAGFAVGQNVTEPDAGLERGNAPTLEELVEEAPPVGALAWDTKVYNKGDAEEIARQEAEAQAEAMTEELMATMIFDDLEEPEEPTAASDAAVTEELVAAETAAMGATQGAAATGTTQGTADMDVAEDLGLEEVATPELPEEEPKEKKHVGLFANLFSKGKTTSEEENLASEESEEEKYISNAWEEINSKAKEEEPALEEAPAVEAGFATPETSATEAATATVENQFSAEEKPLEDAWNALFNKQSETVATEPEVVEEVAPEETVSQDPAEEEVIADEPMTEEAASQDTAEEEAVADEPMMEETASQEPAEEQAVAEETATEETVSQDPAEEEVIADEPMTEEAASQDSAEEEAVADEPMMEETVSQEPAVEKVAAEEPAVVDVWSTLFNKTLNEAGAQEAVTEEPVAQEKITEEPTAQETATEEPVAQEDISVEGMAPIDVFIAEEPLPPAEKAEEVAKVAPVEAAADDELRATFAEALDLEQTPALDKSAGMAVATEGPAIGYKPTNAEGVAYEEGKQEPTPDSNTVTDWNNLFNRTPEEQKEVQEVVPGIPVINAPEEDSHIITVEDILSGKPLPDLSDEPAEKSFGFATPAPAWEGTIEEASVQEEAITEAPVEPAAIEEAPVEKAAIEEAPVEPTAIDETPVEKAAIEEAPVEPTAIEETPVQEGTIAEAPATVAKEQSVQNLAEQEKELTSEELEKELFAEMADADANLSESEKLRRRQTEKIDKFYTFNKKNEEFQELLDQEYEKFKASHANDDIGRDLNKFEDTEFYEDFTVRGASQAVEMAKARATFFGEELKMPTAEQYYPEEDPSLDDGFYSAGEDQYEQRPAVAEPPEDAEPIDPNKISDETQIWDMTLPIEEEAMAVRDAFVGEMPPGEIFAEDDFLSELPDNIAEREETLRALADSPEFGEMPNEEGVFPGAATAVTEAAPAAAPGFFESRRIKREEKRAREDAAEMAENAAAEAKADSFLSRLAADGYIPEQPSGAPSSFQTQGSNVKSSDESASFFRAGETQVAGASHGSSKWGKDSLPLEEEEEEEEEKGSGRIGVFLLSLLSVILVILVVLVVIRIALPDSIISLKIDSFIDGILNRPGGAVCWPIHFYDLF